MTVTWFVKRISEKFAVFFRGLKIQITFRSGKHISVLGKVYLNTFNINFGRNVTLYPGIHIFGPGKVVLGDNVSIGDGVVICAAKDISIGMNTMIAAHCYITDCNHGMHLEKPMREQPSSIHPTTIGDDVWLGCGCKILAGSTIETGAVIGAGTVINGYVEENTICFSERVYCKSSRK